VGKDEEVRANMDETEEVGSVAKVRGGTTRETVTAIQKNFSPNQQLTTGGLSAGPSRDDGSVQVPGLHSDQVQCLLSLIDGPSCGYETLSGNDRWMLDNGASSHMVGNVTLLSKVDQICLVAIGLPNGTYTMVTIQGLMTLGQGMELQNVLYVPKLNCNLVSRSKLCK